MKYKLFFFICLAGHSLFAQVKTDDIWGSWVKTKLTYKNGSELPEENILRNIYVKYTFTFPDKMNISQDYYENGPQFIFEILNNEIILRTPEGSIINDIRIEELSGDRLVLQQKGYQGFEDPTALKYTFTRERVFQNTLTLAAGDVYAIIGADTIYKRNPKVYASYKGESFQRYLTSHISDGNYMTGRNGHLVASFIVSNTGTADSLKILESIDKDFDKRFTKAFNSAKKDWKPAVLNGKYVAVQMFVELSYGTFEPAFLAGQFTDKANIAFKQKDWQAALYYYDQALKNHSSDKENLYNRGICKKMLGNLAGACEDWKKLKSWEEQKLMI